MSREELVRDLLALAERFSEGWHDGIKIDALDIELLADAAQALAEKPAQRTWVGLTRAERLQIEKDMMKYYDYQRECKTVCLPEFARAIEAKLKEKNT